MIFAAGFGTRMGALTARTPKPMLPLDGKPMIDRAIEIGKGAGVSKIVANTHYLADKIEPHLTQKGIAFRREHPDILDTGGGLRAAKGCLSSPTFTLNPDVVWVGSNPLSVLQDAWSDEWDALLAVVPLKNALGRQGGGDFSFDGALLNGGGDFVYTGAQIIKLATLDAIPDKIFSLRSVWDKLASEGRLRGVLYPGSWMDVGSPEGLKAANELLRS